MNGNFRRSSLQTSMWTSDPGSVPRTELYTLFLRSSGIRSE